MDYRMYSGDIKAGENVVSLIKQELKRQNIKMTTPLKFVGFQGMPGTEFKLNGHKEIMKIPTGGSFITPYTGERFMSIYSLVFEENFNGDIYYIV